MSSKKVHFSNKVTVCNENVNNLDNLSEKKPNLEPQQEDEENTKQRGSQRRVRFASQVQYYEIPSEYEEQPNQKHFVESQWKQYDEVSKDIQALSGLHALDDGKVIEDALESITGKLDQQMKYIAVWSFSQANSPSGLPHITTSKDDRKKTTENTEQLIVQKINRQTSPCRTEGRKTLFKEMATTDAQRTVLSATEANSMAHIMAEFEIVHNEIENLALEAAQNHWWVAKQYTNSDAAATHLIKSTKRKAEDENRKWSEVAKNVGKNKDDELRARVDEIVSSASKWRKERQKRLDSATKLMAAVDKEKSVKVRTQMVGQRSDLSQEVIIVEAAKIVLAIKSMVPHCDIEQVLDEQHHYLTTKMIQQQASAVIQEVLRTLSEES